LDEAGRIIGQLHGGNANCNTFEAFFGRFSLSWDEGPSAAQRLEDWLDPEGTGQLILDALEPIVENTITINGNIKARTGQNMSNVKVSIISDAQTSYVFTDTDGNYSIEVPQGQSYIIEPHKDTLADNGISTLDIVMTARHVLLIAPFSDPMQIVAADSNNSGSVSSFDIVRMRQVILDVNDEFPESESWRFSPNNIEVTADMTIDFIGIKIGDPSGNANPN